MEASALSTQAVQCTSVTHPTPQLEPLGGDGGRKENSSGVGTKVAPLRGPGD